MKSLGFIFSFLSTAQARRSVRIFAWMLVLLLAMVAIYSVAFHQVMALEGQSHSWLSAIYWTVVTISTLGFGDITFESDLGRAFSVLVLLTGAGFILVLLPFTFIQFVFLPWMESSQRARAPRHLAPGIEGHVLLTSIGPIEQALIRRLDRAKIPYATLVDDVDDALKLHDEGYRVMVGALDDPDTFRAAQVHRAALVVATQVDTANTNIAFTVRETSESVDIVATANREASVDILQLAGCDQVLRLGDMLGQALARRVLVPDGRCYVIGEFDNLRIAEAKTPGALVGLPLVDSGLRQETGLTVAGLWERGRLEVATASTVLTSTSTLVLAGSSEQLASYNRLFGTEGVHEAPVIVIGGGRVGRAAARTLRSAGIEYRIVEQQAERVRDVDRYIVGDAANLDVLERAGIHESSSVIITTHDDDVNVYLTIYCRRLRPDMQVIARARLDRNVTTLHRAGADAVLSYASTGATAIWNVLSADSTLQLAEGLDVFRVPVPAELVGRTLAQSDVRDSTGCTVVALANGDRFESNPDKERLLPAGSDLVLIGDSDSEHRFLTRYSPTPDT